MLRATLRPRRSPRSRACARRRCPSLRRCSQALEKAQLGLPALWPWWPRRPPGRSPFEAAAQALGAPHAGPGGTLTPNSSSGGGASGRAKSTLTPATTAPNGSPFAAVLHAPAGPGDAFKRAAGRRAAGDAPARAQRRRERAGGSGEARCLASAHACSVMRACRWVRAQRPLQNPRTSAPLSVSNQRSCAGHGHPYVWCDTCEPGRAGCARCDVSQLFSHRSRECLTV